MVSRGTFLDTFVTKPFFDPEDGRFSSWKQTFLESTGKTGLTTWGSKLACGHSKGSKKWFSPSLARVLAHAKVKNPFLTLKMADSALENKHFLNLQEKQAWGHSKGSKNGFCPSGGGRGGGGPWKVKNYFWPWKQQANLPLLILSTAPCFGFWVYGPKQVLKWIELHFWTLFPQSQVLILRIADSALEIIHF